jgi:hypothetical protein
MATVAVESCPHCGNPIARTDRTCPHCGKGLTGKALLAENRGQAAPIESHPAGAILLTLLGLVLAGIGAATLTQATLGVGLIAGGCFAAIFARIVQAGAHHRQMMRK